MLGNGILAFAVIILVVIFVYVSMRFEGNQEQERKYTEVYRIQLMNGFRDHSYTLYLNDSILYNDRITNEPVVLTVTRFEQQSALLLVDNETEKVVTIELSERGGDINLVKEGESIKQIY